jgi:hypothetical protein
VVDFLDDASTAPVRHGVHGDAFGQTWSKRRRIWLQAREGTRRQLEVDKAEAGRVVAVGGGGVERSAVHSDEVAVVMAATGAGGGLGVRESGGDQG